MRRRAELTLHSHFAESLRAIPEIAGIAYSGAQAWLPSTVVVTVCSLRALLRSLNEHYES
jgi:hypothetical protein